MANVSILKANTVVNPDGTFYVPLAKVADKTPWKANLPLPADTVPLMNADEPSAGSSMTWARADHVHPANTAMLATMKDYVDEQNTLLQEQISSLAQNLRFVGQTNVVSDSTKFTTGSGITPNPGVLPPASTAFLGFYTIVIAAGQPPAGSNIPAGDYAMHDWIVCDGTTWQRLDVGATASTASTTAVMPAIGGMDDVQEVLEHLYDTVPMASETVPSMDGIASVGVSTEWSHGDHVHPVDTSRYAASNPAGYVDPAGAAAAAPVQSVAARTGAVVLTHADITDWATALNPYYPVTNPANYVDAAGARTAAPVQSVAARIGAITLTHADITDWVATLQPYALTTAIPAPSSSTPTADGTAAAGTALTWARADHIHPTDVSRYAASNPSGFQTAAQVAAAVPAAATTPPVMDGTAAAGTGTTWARADHKHPVDTSRAPVMGVTDASNALAGQIGEYIVSANQTGVQLTTAVGLTVASINLTPGCYEAWGLVDYSLDASKSPTMIAAAISGVNNTLPTDTAIYTGIGNMMLLNLSGLTAGQRQVLMTGQCRVNTSTPLTLYVVANAVWTGGGTLLTKGYICARRVR
jgi:hypothetical protein